jgi:Ubiquitin-binding domain
MGNCCTSDQGVGGPAAAAPHRRRPAQQHARRHSARRPVQQRNAGSAAANEWDNPTHWTPQTLGRARDTFWETRVEGRPEVWEALHLASQSVDDETKQVILVAADVTPFDMAGNTIFCYDQLGARYDMPVWAMQQPSNMLTEAELAKEQHNVVQSDEKIAPAKFLFRVRIAYEGKDVEVDGAQVEVRTAYDLKKVLQQQHDYDVDKQRLIMQGRLLNNRDGLVASGLAANGCIQLMVKK